MKAFCIFLIKCYQYSFSLLFPSCCRFFPSCSNYSIEAIKKYGCIKGIILTIKRLLKCGWWHPGGYDPVVNPKESLVSDQDIKQQMIAD